MDNPIYIDVFAGCGGASIGLMNSGWKGIFAIEKSSDAFNTLKYNLIDIRNHFQWPSWLPVKNHCINEIINNHKAKLKNLERKVDLIMGGPPCQGFSTAGKRNENDNRNKLVDSYIQFIKIIKPSLLFFENVKGFTNSFIVRSTSGRVYSDYVLQKLKAIGYNVHAELLDFSEYGIPQRRKRFILVGSLLREKNHFFSLLEEKKSAFLKTKGLKIRTVLNDAISDLLMQHGIVDSPDTKHFKAGIYANAKSTYQNLMRKEIKFSTGAIADSHRFANHKNETKEKFIDILTNAPRNKELRDFLKEKYKSRKRTVVLLDKNEICPTLTTLPDDYIHYCEPRILTVRECARIQSFPDWFQFKSKYTTGNSARKKDTPRYTQVGNAIPPLFSELCGLILKEMLLNG